MSSGRLSGRTRAGHGGRGRINPRWVLCLAGLVLAAGSAQAEERDQPFARAAAETCVPTDTAPVNIEKSAEDGVFIAPTGQRYFTSDLYFPDPRPAPEDSGTDGVTGAVSGFEAFPNGPANRWGLTPAWIVLRDGDAGELLQAVQLMEGAAVFAPEQADSACAGLLRLAETAARRDHRGLWADKTAAPVYSAARPGLIEEKTGDYVIVRGRVVSLGKTESTRYLNFGKYWKTDFTATLKTSDEAIFNAALGRSGWKVEELAGKFVELRGFVQVRDGPHIALPHPEQLVVLEHPAFD
ncbi:hypothetical protein [Roseibium marinum]|uniref:Nuclease n=1 Tax=Roseibium marinum TaxID=281252 RepID=A0A2S3UYY7_9HYPH|nr:hypothetical protein [Roseibium marinum]POF32753.1 hypothetical protein CLV41_102157 [Roseibium marinum]